jgi:chromosomal replication initiator protein
VEHLSEPTADSLWHAISGRLRERISDTTYNTWFAHAEPRSLGDGRLEVSVPNDFTRDWIESHFHGFVSGAARETLGRDVAVSFTVADRPHGPSPARDVGPVAPESPRREHEGPFHDITEVELNPKYTFDLFVIGSSNRFAHAAALAVAEAPAQAYNPLFIYGSTGLGKTHLLQAIGHYVRQHSRRLTMRYVTSETFMNDFIDSLRDKRIEGFKRRYRNYDVLLVDDIQFFEGKERIQEEFFHTFNSLYEGGAQIIISSDRPPREIATLEERLRSRFEWGLLTDIQAPDLETRIAILRKKVNTEQIAVTDPEVLTFIAGRVSTNIRELEGALTRVVAFSSLTDRPMTVELAEHVLKDVFPQGEAAPEVTIPRIQEAVSQRFGVTLDELVSPRRSQAVAYPRQVAMYLSRELTDSSLPKIGR